jgi:hypothetical protein
MSEVAQAKTMRERVERLEAVLTHVEPGEYQLRHRFAPGVYMREMLIPANQIATGAVHKTKHLTIVVGHCYLTDDERRAGVHGLLVVRERARNQAGHRDHSGHHRYDDPSDRGNRFGQAV